MLSYIPKTDDNDDALTGLSPNMQIKNEYNSSLHILNKIKNI
jgi:hypothetical protein